MIEIKVLGTGCAKCKRLFQNAEQAVSQSGIEAQVIKVEKIDEIISYGVAMTPALLIGSEVKSAGRIPEVREIVTWLTTEASKS